LKEKGSGSGLENLAYGLGIRRTDHAIPSIRRSWHYLRRQSAVARSVWLVPTFADRGVSHGQCGAVIVVVVIIIIIIIIIIIMF
jgi:hypothetical protein